MQIFGSYGRATVCAALAAAAMAGAAPLAVAAERDRSGVIEEIVVTSRRAEESQQDVPVSVTAFNQNDVDRIQPRTLRDFEGLTPNVYIGEQTAGPNMGAIFIRGQGYQDVEKNQPPAVGVIIDNIYLGTNTGQLIDTFDVAQVEINRGPQGVLYGKNTTGGTIVVRRVEPQYNEFGWVASAQAGDYDERQLKARVNIPLIDDAMALKLGVITKERDGYYDNITLGGDAGAIDYTAYTAALKWQATDDFLVKITYDRLDDQSDSVAMDPRYNGNDPFKSENDWDAQTDYEQDMLGVNLEWNIGSATLYSTTAWIDGKDNVEQDFDSSTYAAVDFDVTPPLAPTPLAQLHTLRDQNYEQFSQELRLSGEFDRSLSYTVGLFYWDTKIELDQYTNAIAQLQNPLPITCAQFGALDGTGIVPGFLFPHPVLGDAYCQTPYAPDPTGKFGPLLAGISTQNGSEDTESKAVFGSITWRPSEAYEVSAGARYIDEQKTLQNNFVSAPGGAPTPAGFPVKDSDSWDDVILNLSGSWFIAEDSTLYLSYAEGFRSGGYSIRANNVSQLTYDPEEVKSYEIGWKNDLWDRRLRLNLSAFYTDMKNQQLNVVIQDPFQAPGTNTVVNNAGDTEIKGLELEGIAALTDSFSVIFSGGLLDAERKSYQEDGGRVPTGPLGTAGTPGTLVTIPANDLARSPDWNWALTGVYDRQFGNLRLTASATLKGWDDVNIISSTLAGPAGNYSEDGQTKLDARVALEWTLREGDILTLSVFGKNLTDEEYLEFLLPLGDTGGFQGWAAPKTIAAEIRWSH
ncbi:MAG: TonB-dependent receptor [Pseudomonadales bacterium]